MTGDEPALGPVAAGVAAEFPDLRLWWRRVEITAPRGDAGLRERLRHLGDRFRGARAVALRAEPIPHAYRAFYRQIGLDPDVQRVPIEAHVVERLMAGGLRSGTAVEDAVTIATMETSVPVWALDADAVAPPLGIRPAAAGERLGGRHGPPPPLPAGRLVVADAGGPVATLFGDVAAALRPGPRTRRAVLFSVQVPGVPDLHVSEALWTACDALED